MTRPDRTEPLGARQISALAPEAPDLSGLIDILTTASDPRHLPTPRSRATCIEAIRPPHLRLAEDSGEGWPDHWPRPSRLLPRPDPVER
ncbi:hypothetical protein DPM13_14840 [Paracoccus mutanolyticus]|uniref:Uncharacterized protein n=1 Tax=Paracoccus mutanolyticus TaxID=1499308 RepID=A0ABM6WTH5_9RHOB|nr:hypothetical protein [Paracoccus mutanolyticus]AWX93870.1 hypothetical protein DPM13_14840 [Paracoccus mutanolyticus]